MRLGTPCVITICYTLKRGSELGLGEVEFLLNKGWLKEFKEMYPNFARLNLKIVWVRPEEALKMFNHPFSGGTPVKTGGIREDSVKRITEGLKGGAEFPPLLHFHVPEGYKSRGGKIYHWVNEGRNRAFVSWKFGVKRIPVLIDA